MIYTRIIAAFLVIGIASGAFAQAVKVELRETNGNYELHRDGKPYFIQGAGGDASRELLKQSGGNSFRTWGADNIDDRLDEAHRLGLTVAVGIWLGHERHGFNYNDAKQVAKQYEKARQAVLKYKDHPAVLLWSVGNEMEGYAEGDNAAVWSAVNNIASMIKKLDPNHPTMTVIADVGGQRIPSIHAMCPDIDIVGINSYGGGPSVAQRYRAAGGTKPFIITEFGPAGTWEIGKNAWGAPQELTSTAKADTYRATYEQSILAEKGKLCLGSYVFAWGNKQEATATWFGLFLSDGTRLEAMDTMAELWSGKAPANRCPRIQPIEVVTGNRVKSGEIIRARVAVSDPENDPLKIEWRLAKDMAEYQTGGDFQAEPPSYPDAIVKQGGREVEVRMPDLAGGYFLYAVVHDDKGGGAVANVPLYVEGETKAPQGKPVAKFPFVIYADGVSPLPYIPSGWMGNHGAIAMDEKWATQPRSGATCMKLEYRAPDGFAGIVWQDPPNDWGDRPGGYNLSGAKRLTFWARGETGTERVEFKLGIIGPDKPFPDSDSAALPPVTLTREWKQYSIDLTNKDLSRIKTPFLWSLPGQGKAVTFYLDDIRFE